MLLATGSLLERSKPQVRPPAAYAIAVGVKVCVEAREDGVGERGDEDGWGRGDATYTFRRFSRNQPVLMDAWGRPETSRYF